MEIAAIVGIAVGGAFALGLFIWLIAYPVHKICAKIKNVKRKRHANEKNVEELRKYINQLEGVVYKDAKTDLQEFLETHKDIPIEKLQEFIEQYKEKQ